MATFSKRHYEAVASLLNERFVEIARDRDEAVPVYSSDEYHVALDAMIQTATAFELMFSKDNAAFDSDRWRKAVTSNVVSSGSRKAER